MLKSKIQKNIPEGWRQMKLGEVCDIVMGQSPSSNSYNENFIGIPLIQGNNDIKKGKIIENVYTSEITKISEKDSIILTVRAPVGCIGIAHKKVCIGRGVCSINAKKENQDFIFYFLKFFEPKWVSLEQGSTFTAVNSSDIKKLKFVLPPLPEQNCIVMVLETWDEYLEKLSKKIEAKKNIKKGLMQKLLTGKKRLSGFNNKWEILLLNDICKIKTGKKDVNEGNPNGRYPFFTCAKEYTYSDNYSFNTEAILIAGNGEVGNCQYYKGRFEAYQRTYILSDFLKNIKYVFNYLNYFFQNFIDSKKQMGAMPYIKIDMLKNYEIKIPKDLKEQKAIAEVLTTADQEIEALEEKKKIIKVQKKYLLNNLITGKIRVPV